MNATTMVNRIPRREIARMHGKHDEQAEVINRLVHIMGGMAALVRKCLDIAD